MVNMADNWLPSFDMDEQRAIDKHIPQQLAPILAEIQAKKNAISTVTDADRAAHRQFLAGISKNAR